MNKNLFYLSLICIATFFGCNQVPASNTQSVNAVIGDQSFIEKYGHQPDATTDNTLRIKTHLEYVEGILRNRDISNLPSALQEQRNHLLDVLHNYWTKSVFPTNYDYTERKPCFIDKDDNICAVGYLIEQTAGRKVAEEINRKFKYEELLAMNDQNIDDWIVNSGLTKEECAMIQPTYGGIPVPGMGNSSIYTARITPFYAISSAIIGAGNLSLSAVNIRQAVKKSDNNTVPLISLVTGAGQILLGSQMLDPEAKVNYEGRSTTAKQEKNYNTLSKAHIAMGSVTMISAAWNLIANRKPKTERTSWNLSSFETHDKNAGLALSLTRTF
jgi:hypothetical protein